ncbi:hypothetical protein AOLI_G00095920 [Acnodon oligacanthus]
MLNSAAPGAPACLHKVGCASSRQVILVLLSTGIHQHVGLGYEVRLPGYYGPRLLVCLAYKSQNTKSPTQISKRTNLHAEQ